MELSNIKNIYFIGIGGIGMSALARWFLANGFAVAGYDKTASDLTAQLQVEGMTIHYEDDINLIPQTILNTPTGENLIIYTPAVPAEHTELQYFKTKGYRLWKRAEVLGLLTRNYFNVGVAGTHGKTTTSSMIAHLLHRAGKPCTAFLGGILKNYDSNLLLAQASDNEPIMVVEADEYDRSFLQLSPDMAVITSIEADHLDIYGDTTQIEASFRAFAQKIKPQGNLFLKKGIDLQLPDNQGFNIKTYAINESADYYAENIRIEQGRFWFDWGSAEERIDNLSLAVVGFHNVENATAAIAVVRSLGLSDAEIRAGIADFAGAKRRFDFIIREPNLVFADDYAHHPTEVRALLSSARALYPDKKITVIFQPHLFTRTRDFMDEFAQSLSLADEVILLDIYPAREQAIEGISSEVLLAKIKVSSKTLASKTEVIELMKTQPIEVLFTVGAGDIDRLIPDIKKALESSVG
ncbi:MAG: UDP-N-acetylmuramate--L-alanine ligase [Microscillaceae bacterium]|jgi:UDP-N-acetylmuramate--alanine ligase|nr:UDP-N-acetylmuramate--L-alanine ligase [Microscillaceae bacterium]